ncbi:MAG: hypothetical protein GWP08_19475, partial [Nitrospiraceae bacterium]|nr:hypothetical protein [Nitrospiraceae bacterium]
MTRKTHSRRASMPFASGHALTGLALALVFVSVLASAQPDVHEKASCGLDYVNIAIPRDNSVIYTNSVSDFVPFPIGAITNCPDDTREVEFTLNGATLGDDDEAPFSLTSVLMGSLSTVIDYTLTATATKLSATSKFYEDSVDFRVAQLQSGVDQNFNGYLDNPFFSLPFNGYTWIATVPVGDPAEYRVVGMTRWAGSGGTVDSHVPVTLVLENPDD